MTLYVRRLSQADAGAFRETRPEGLRHHPEALGASLREEQAQPLEWFADWLGAGFVLGGETPRSGSTALLAFVPEAEKTQHKGTLWGMYVRPEARRIGLGHRLVKAVVEHARTQAEEVILGVSVENWAAIASYRSAGFEIYALDPRALKAGGIYIDGHEPAGGSALAAAAPQEMSFFTRGRRLRPEGQLGVLRPHAGGR